METGLCDIKSAKLSYRLYGDLSKPLIVVETALGASQAEWWHLAEQWSAEYSLLLYDRAGYGRSSRSTLRRNPENIARELNELLKCLQISKPAILIGHSMGGLYAYQFTRMFPQKSCGLILLDPVSPDNYLLKQRLTREEYFQCGFDKSMNMKLGLVLTSVGLGFALKPLFKKGPPFYYRSDFSKEAETAILQNVAQRKTYRASMEEYKVIDSDRTAGDPAWKTHVSDIPLVLICHSHDVMSTEIMQYGGASSESALKCDNIWLALMKEYLETSTKSSYILSTNSGHFIHLSDPDSVWNAIQHLVTAS